MSKTKKDLVLGIMLTVVFLLFTFVYIPIAVEVYDPQGVTPATWPRFVALSITLLAFILVVSAGIALKVEKYNPDDTAAKTDWTRFGLTTICLISFYFLVDFLGIVLASMIVFLCFSRICGKCNWKIVVPIALILPIVLYFFFTKLAHVPMPLGVFYDLW